MNVEVREQLGAAELAVRSGDAEGASAAFIAAGDRAAHFQLYRTATRCYRHALELDLFDRAALAQLIGLVGRGGHAVEWSEYARVVDRVDWPHFGCRGAQMVIGDHGAFVECPRVGPVLDIAMPAEDRVEAQPDGRFARMPIAMAMIILRRALWSFASEPAVPPRNIGVVFGGRGSVVLDELGEWRST